MSYYAGQQGGQYPDEYSAPSTPRDPSYPQWEQQPQQESQHSQEHLQQPLEHSQQSQQGLEQPQQQHHQPLPLPPPSQPSMYLEDPQHLVPSQIPQRGTHDLTPIRLLPVVGQPPTRSPPVEIKPVMLQVDTAVRSTAHAGPSTRPASRARPHQYHPYAPRPSSASGNTRREFEAPPHVRFASQTNTPQAHPGSAMHSPAARQTTFTSPMRCATRFPVHLPRFTARLVSTDRRRARRRLLYRRRPLPHRPRALSHRLCR
ncbi:hypothetical protein B0H17DRAFT_323390 [Mycena rosella]|uniref:Uncharacterized protein n=1 Tax=Mycena rosella TaxID=1033263 RepID=A0AAD7DS86_MYCRO|nr:hypothetical protein B0H17DRAFT_323390 [Mycena rosella]